MKQFLWINPSILRKESSVKIKLSDGFFTTESKNRAFQPIIDRTNNYRFYNSKFIFDTSNFVIPNLQQYCLNFDEVCSLRCRYIFNLATKENKKIFIVI